VVLVVACAVGCRLSVYAATLVIVAGAARDVVVETEVEVSVAAIAGVTRVLAVEFDTVMRALSELTPEFFLSLIF